MMSKDETAKRILIRGQDYSLFNEIQDDVPLRPIKESFLRDYTEKVQSHDLDNPFIVNQSSKNKKQKQKTDFVLYANDKSNNLVGIIRDKNYTPEGQTETYDITLEISSRMDTNNDKPYFLLKMLCALCDDLQVTDNAVPSNMNELFEFYLIYLYKAQLLKNRFLGHFRSYVRFERNDDRVRGSIDVSRHIRLNGGLQNGKIAYSYREKTTDNAFNHLIIHTYLEMKKRFPERTQSILQKDHAIYELLNELMVLAPSYQGVSVRAVMEKNRNPISQPYYQPYEALREICFRILNHSGLSLFSGDGDDVDGVLFYMPDLWELYLESELTKHLAERDIKVSAQEEIKILKKARSEDKNKEIKILKKAGSEDEYKKNTYPDFVFSFEQKRFMILDAKFRPAWESVLTNGKIIGELDADYNKCIRDMNSIGAHATGVIFPMKADKKEDCNTSKFEISEFNGYDRFYAFAIPIPDAEGTYSAWEKKLNKSLMDEITASLEEEKDFVKKIAAKEHEIKNVRAEEELRARNRNKRCPKLDR